MNNSAPLNLRNSLRYAWMPLIGLFPAILTLTVTGVMIAGGTPAADFALPVTAMCGMSLAISLIFGLVIGTTILLEMRGISAARSSPWVTWPQFESEGSWREANEEEYQQALKAAGFTLGPLISIGVILVFVVGMTNFFILPSSGSPFPSLIGIQIAVILFILYLVAAVAMNLGAIVQRTLAAQRNARQKSMNIPNVFVNQHGIYDEHKGYESWRWLNGVTFRDKGGDSSARIVFKYHRPANFLRRMPSADWRVEARVPPGQEGEGQMIVKRVKSEILREA